MKPLLNEAKEKLQAIVSSHNLGEAEVRVNIGTLTVNQAIGSPNRKDFPLLQGKEVMIEARVMGSCGQAFTDKPAVFSGKLNDILKSRLDSDDNRAIFIATLNAVAAHLKLVDRTQHCRDEEPEECAAQIAGYVLDSAGRVRVGLIGLQPAILDNLVKTFGKENVRCTDLNPNNVNTEKYGIVIWDGRTETERLIKWCDILLATSSTIVNNTYDEIKETAAVHGKRLIIFGVTGAGIAALTGVEILCFKSL